MINKNLFLMILIVLIIVIGAFVTERFIVSVDNLDIGRWRMQQEGNGLSIRDIKAENQKDSRYHFKADSGNTTTFGSGPDSQICIGPKENNWCMKPDGNNNFLNLVRNNDTDGPNKGFYKFTEYGDIWINRALDQKNATGWLGEATLKYALLGVGTDNKLYIKTSLTGPWSYIGDNSCCVICAIQMNDQRILGIGTDYRLYVKNKIGHDWWGLTNDQYACCVVSICQLKDDSFLAVGTDGNPYSKPTLTGPWKYEGNNTSSIKWITQFNDGTFVAIGRDSKDKNFIGKENKVFTKKNLSDNWVATNSDNTGCCVISIVQAPDGIIYGVGTDNKIWYKYNLENPWIFGGHNTWSIKGISIYKGSL